MNSIVNISCFFVVVLRIAANCDRSRQRTRHYINASEFIRESVCFVHVYFSRFRPWARRSVLAVRGSRFAPFYTFLSFPSFCRAHACQINRPTQSSCCHCSRPHNTIYAHNVHIRTNLLCIYNKVNTLNAK